MEVIPESTGVSNKASKIEGIMLKVGLKDLA